MTAIEYIKNLRVALASNAHARGFYFPRGKAARKRMNLRLAREIGYGLGDYSESDALDVAKTLYSTMIVKNSFDSTGVVIDNKEFMVELQASMCKVREDRAVVLIIDGNNMAYRALYTMQLSHRGADTSITYGTINMIMSLSRKYNPRAILVCFDGGVPRHRRALLPEYKRHRKKDDSRDWAAVYRQIDELHDMVLPIHGMMTLKAADVEADDLMYHAAKMSLDRPYIVTTDNDLLQAVDNKVNVLNPVRGIIYTLDNFEKEVGVPVERYVMYKALMGDSSDNIPGVRGIGPKTAQKMLRDRGWADTFPAYLNKRQLSNYKDALESGSLWDAYDVIDLQPDRCGAHKRILERGWSSARPAMMKKYAIDNGFISLLEMGGAYYGAFLKLGQPVFDSDMRHPVCGMDKEPV